MPGSASRRHRRPQLQRSAAAHAGALLRSGTARTGHHRADRRLHVRHGGQRQRLRHRLDLRHLPRAHSERRHRRALRQHGPLVHDPRRADQHRHRLPGDARSRASWTTSRPCSASSSRRCSAPCCWACCGSGRPPRADSGACLPAPFRPIGMWAWVKVDPSALRYIALSRQRQGHGREHVPRAVVLDQSA